MTITIISGAPGCGKTSLARYLADQQRQGVHLETDLFFSFVRHRLDPSLPGSQNQNASVARAYLAAALEYQDGGYDVYLDGVIGPWWFELIENMLGSFDYLLLHAPLDLCLQRISERSGQSSATASVAMRMQEQFSAIIVNHPANTISTDGSSVVSVAAEFQGRRQRGELRLPASD